MFGYEMENVCTHSRTPRPKPTYKFDFSLGFLVKSSK